MTGLAPNTSYFYRVGDAAGGFSAVLGPVRTLPSGAGGAAGGPPLRIAVVGDMGWGNASDGTVAALTRLADAGAIDVLVHNGDIGYADGEEHHWDVYMRKTQPVMSRIPTLTTPGNHEFYWNFSAYKTRFSMPANGFDDSDNMFWSLDVGPNLHITAMNTETAVDVPFMNAAQLRWLKDDLAAVAGSGRWIVTFGHRPFYCTAGCEEFHVGAPILRKLAEEVLLDGGVDLAVQAHVHDWERTWPVARGVPTQTNYSRPSAPVYVTNGAGGNREGNDTPKGGEAWCPPAAPGHAPRSRAVGFGVLRVAGGTLGWTQYASGDGSEAGTVVIDEFAIER